MNKQISMIDTIDQVISSGVSKGVMQLSTGDIKLQKNLLTIENRQVVNFGSCSYLGLEFDPRLINGSIEATRNYGTQFSSSRAYISLGLYDELEDLFGQIFKNPCIVAPTTSLGHLSAIPVMVDSKDAVILDHQVHTSVQQAVNIVKSKGNYTEVMRHNRMDLLEERILELRKKHPQVWYMADGVYSMYGDYAPMKTLEALMNKYPEFRVYIDDAHGMSWAGQNGCGYALSQIALHKQMIVAVSLAKGFATGGAVLVFPTKEQARRVRTCGSTMLTSGPMQPAMLGAAVESAKLHLSDEFISIQQEEEDNIRYCNLMLKKAGLPDISEANSPIFFVGVSLPKLGTNILQRMLHRGYYLNYGIFPAVPLKNTGVRFTITRLHTFEQIEEMVNCLAEEFPKAMEEEHMSMEKIHVAFKLNEPAVKEKKEETNTTLELEHLKTADELNVKEWNSLLGNRGSFSVEGLKILERTFRKKEDALPENNWDFDYVTIRENGVPVLATFFTTTLSKEDMLSPASVSSIIEGRRKFDPYYLTSRVLTLGSMLTEGTHLYIDKSKSSWKKALLMMLDMVNRWQEERSIQNTVFRDFHGKDVEIDNTLLENGFIKIPMPDFHDIVNFTWQGKEEFLKGKSKNTRDYWKRKIFRYEHLYNAVWNKSEKNLRKYYELYLNIKGKSLDINTFDLPYELFEEMVKDKNWDVLELYYNDPETKVQTLAAVSFNFIGEEVYCPMIIGVEPSLSDYMPYRQAAYEVLKRVTDLGIKQIRFGFGATIEKQYWGAKPCETWAYLQARDNYTLEFLNSLNNQKVKI